MTMHSRISHSFKLSVPFLLLLAAIVAAGAFGVFIVDPLVTNDPTAAPFVATLGAGIDEFSKHGSNILRSAMPKDAGGWIASIAVFVTIWSVIKVIREMHGPVGGAGDGGALVSHGIQRVFIAMGVRMPGVPWGVVRDSSTRHPLSLATVRLVGVDGTILDSSVSDGFGRYGFRLSHAAAIAHGYHTDIQTRKSGYYFRPAARGGAHQHAEGLDILMDRAGDGPVPVHVGSSLGRRVANAAGTLAFWLGVLLVPLAFLRAPNALHGMMFAAFAGAGVVRATWLHPRRS